MLLDLIPLVIAAVVGLRLQRLAAGERIRLALWQGNYVVVLPVAASYAFLSIDLDRHLLTAVACSLAAWWLTVLASYVWARSVARTRSMRGALTLVGAFPNTTFLGYPLAHLAFGTEGLRLAVVYDQVSLVIPAIVVATIIARTHMRASASTDTETGAAPAEPSAAAVAGRLLATSPPFWAVVVLIVLRATVVRDPVDLDWLGTIVGHVVGPVGFLLLGLSLPLHGFEHDRRDVLEVAGASAVRLAVAPLLVWAVASITGTHVPHALYLASAMPTAFLALVAARNHDLEVATVRLGIVISTVAGVLGTVAYVALR
jgi:predicted permease